MGLWYMCWLAPVGEPVCPVNSECKQAPPCSCHVVADRGDLLEESITPDWISVSCSDGDAGNGSVIQEFMWDRPPQGQHPYWGLGRDAVE